MDSPAPGFSAAPTLAPADWCRDFIRQGRGPALLLLHGWPFHNLTFRKLLPLLENEFTCYLPNALGMNAAGFTADTDFSFAAHAERALAFADDQQLDEFYLLGHDTGGTVARLLTVAAPQQVRKLVLLNTEIPGHRPPFVPLFQKLSYLPGNRAVFTRLLRNNTFLRSKMGFGGSFYDPARIDDEFLALFASHWTRSPQRYRGLMRYLQGIDFSVVDDLSTLHQQIHTPTHFVWGQDDVTFPIAPAQQMAKTIPGLSGFDAIADAAFLVHEERPQAVADSVTRFLIAAEGA